MVELIKVIGSSGAIAGWVVWKDWPMLWSGLIAAAQLLDATKHVFPFARLHKAASEMTVAFELLCIDAEAELMEILAADQPDPAMIARRKRLAKLGVETEHKQFPDGFQSGETLKRKAKRIANAYLSETYGQAVGATKAQVPAV
jgi:hypothetical protein